MGVIGRSDHDHFISKGIKALQDCVDDALQLAKFVPVIAQLCDRIHFIKEQHRILGRDEVEHPPDIL